MDVIIVVQRFGQVKRLSVIDEYSDMGTNGVLLGNDPKADAGESLVERIQCLG